MIKKVTDEEPVGQKSFVCQDLFVGKPGQRSCMKGTKHSLRPAKKSVVIVGLPAGEKLRVLTPGVVLKPEELMGSISDLVLREVRVTVMGVTSSEASVPSSPDLVIDLGQAVPAGLAITTATKKTAKKRKLGLTPDHGLGVPRPPGIASLLSAEDWQLVNALELICWRGFSIAAPAVLEVATETAMVKEKSGKATGLASSKDSVQTLFSSPTSLRRTLLASMMMGCSLLPEKASPASQW